MAQISGIEVLKRAMAKRGWDDVRLADESGVHITVIRRWFGKYKIKTVISPKNAWRVASCLGISAEAILFGKKTAA